jgi:hypothetical protein
LVAKDIEAVLQNIEYWHQGAVSSFKILYRDERGIWNVFDGLANAHRSSLARNS